MPHTHLPVLLPHSPINYRLTQASLGLILSLTIYVVMVPVLFLPFHPVWPLLFLEKPPWFMLDLKNHSTVHTI